MSYDIVLRCKVRNIFLISPKILTTQTVILLIIRVKKQVTREAAMSLTGERVVNDYCITR